MHIGIIFSTGIPPCDGIATHVVNLAERLRKRGHEITLITRGNNASSRVSEFQGFRLLLPRYFSVPPFHLAAHKPFLVKALNQLEPKIDVLHLHSPLVPVLPKAWPSVATIHTPMAVDTAHSEGVNLRVLMNKLHGQTFCYWDEQRLLKLADVVLTVSEGVAQELRDHYKFKGEITAIPNVLDLNYFKPAPTYPKELNVLFVGRLAWRKGVFEALKAANLVVEQVPEARFKIAGYGPLERKARDFVRDNSLGDKVEMLGAVRDRDMIVQLQQEARVVLVPSYYEGCPFSLLEAMACGKAIVSTTATFTKGLIDDGVTGRLVEPRKAEPLAAAIVELLNDYEQCRSFGSAIRRYAEKLLEEESNTDKFEHAYKQAIERFEAYKAK